MNEDIVKTGPISPDEVGSAQVAHIPQPVFDVFNRLIGSHWAGKSATIKQEEAVVAVAAAMGITRSLVFSSHYLDVEEAYRSKGWKVHYDKPAYNESYDAVFEFSKP